MEAESNASEKMNIWYSQFTKFKFLNSLANSIGGYGVQCGFKDLMDYLDLNCGAIPEGEFSQVIDVEAADQFLSLYTQVAESRFAFAVTQVLKISPQTMEPMKQFLNHVGEINKVHTTDLKEIFFTLDAFLLDGMPGENQKNITTDSENTLIWENSTDTHKKYWEKYKGDVSNYYILIESFVKGLLSETDISFKIENNSKFTLSK